MNMSELKREDVKIVDDNPETVLSAMIADYETRTGKTLQPAHIERLLINTFAYRETLSRMEINEAYRQQHPRFATGQMLDICGDDVNTPRLEAAPARCTVRFSASLRGSQTVYVPIGTRIATGEMVFATVHAVTLTAVRPTADLQADCEQTGEVGNGWAVGQINTLLTDLPFNTKAVNITIPTGGAETESDDAYRQRILLAPESFSVAGSVGAYEYWARAVSPAICDVRVDNAKDAQGNLIGGEVEVTVLTQKGLPSAELLAQVQSALSAERKRPLCDTVRTKAPAPIDYALDAVLTLFTSADHDSVRASAQASWAAYETSRREKLGLDIVPLDIQAVLKVKGVYNVVLNNLPLRVVQPDQWARCTSVNIRIDTERADG